ncbi:OPT oligopeptide transporter [Aspergillus sclerotioniger CBS 115572]|uniref:OPT oligopeptide transporter n=1 Tax=Aspergillus sclerotioniger CBS 115572 TaxID=1450535 RepID=A0A317VFE6_9EURO|nr:OPT oligopeptide transporter [Aspergillus sclerotioniger CBS 115572]PWY73104.1 OPT oligopeptide transporter [Aspergillus sclerotioniger CBS 115572]
MSEKIDRIEPAVAVAPVTPLATVDELLTAHGQTESLTLDDARERAKHLVDSHSEDPNFSPAALERLHAFLANTTLLEEPEKHRRTVEEAKIEVLLLTENSPYPEVHAVVDPYDDPDLPCGTIRAWVIGLGFVALVAFVNQLFSVRQPSISIGSTVVQFLVFPIGKAAEHFLPDVGLILFGTRHSLNSGPFNRKEHMIISIMASAGGTLPSSRYIIFTQWLDRYFGQPYAKHFGYQILLALSTDLMGFGLAGLLRGFIVYPSFCVWPRSLVTIALNTSLHNEENHSVLGPFQTIFNISRFRFFLVAFALMFVYFWFPDLVFSALSTFDWLAWIAPNDFKLTAITGMKKGLGFNPLPTFDWNIVTHALDPLTVPSSVTINTFFGVLLGGITIIGLYWTNAYHTGYLPINTNSIFDHYGKSHNVSKILDDRGWLDETKYQAYSPVYLAASSLTMYFFFFAVYAASVSYAYLHHRRDIALGFRSLFKNFKRRDTNDFPDVHSRLMSVYKKIPEWWYAILNVVAIVLGVAAIAAWPTYTSVGVVFFGIALALVFAIPTGIIEATTGISVEFNVLAEFIGGAWNPGNTLAMNFSKYFGSSTYICLVMWMMAHVLAFANNLKLAYYVKAQIIAVVVIMSISGICTSDQVNRFTCPGINIYFTVVVLFSSVSIKQIFGTGGQYIVLLSAFLYNIAYMWSAVVLVYINSMSYLCFRYLAFWSKYNYVLSAAFSTAIALAGIIIFFATGREAKYCTRLTLPGGEYFGPRLGSFA